MLSTKRFINLKNCFKFHWATKAYFFLNYSLRTNSAVLLFVEKRTNYLCCSFFEKRTNHLCCSFFLKKEPSLLFFWKNCESDEAITTNLGALRILYIFFIKKKRPRQCFWRSMHFIFVSTKNTFSLHQNWNRFLLLFFPQI